MRHLGEEVHRIVELKGLKKKDVADSAGISPQRFQNLREQPSFDALLLDRLCKAIDVPPAYFFSDSLEDGILTGDINNFAGVGDATVNVGGGGMSPAGWKMIIAEKERIIRILMKQLGIENDIKS